MNGMDVMQLLLLVPGLIIYFIPTFVAGGRYPHPQKSAIFTLNLFLGWTLIGWVIALVWANTTRQEVVAELVEPADSHATKLCPFCAEEIRLEAIKCKHCGSDLASTSA